MFAQISANDPMNGELYAENQLPDRESWAEHRVLEGVKVNVVQESAQRNHRIVSTVRSLYFWPKWLTNLALTVLNHKSSVQEDH